MSNPTTTDVHRARRFRIGLSFAGEKRAFVAGVAAILAHRFSEDKVLYDKYHEAEFARRDLSFYLPKLYHDECDLIVAVLCPDYDPKEWTGLEWFAIHDLLKKRNDGEVMLCRFERAEAKGLFSSAGFVELDGKTPEEAADRILERLALNEGKPKRHYVEPGLGLELQRSSATLPAAVPHEESPSAAVAGTSLPQAVVQQLRVPQFHYGGVVPPDFFIGRSEELDEAEQIARAGQSFLLVGERRAGKTSFCDALIHRVMGARGNDVLVGKLNLDAFEDLTITTFLGHTLINMIGEIVRQVFDLRYSELLYLEPSARRKLSDDAEFGSLVSIHRLVTERVRMKRNASAPSLLPEEFLRQEFLKLTAELLDLIARRGKRTYLIIYDEANRLADELSINLLMNNLEVLGNSRLTTAYAASPNMVSSFDALSAHLPRKVYVGPFKSPAEMRQLLGRYYFNDSNHTDGLPITDSAEQLVWAISGGMPYRIQCLFAYGFARAQRAHESRVTVQHVEPAWLELQQAQPQYFPNVGPRLR
jgi:hypothetical protein